MLYGEGPAGQEEGRVKVGSSVMTYKTPWEDLLLKGSKVAVAHMA